MKRSDRDAVTCRSGRPTGDVFGVSPSECPLLVKSLREKTMRVYHQAWRRRWAGPGRCSGFLETPMPPAKRPPPPRNSPPPGTAPLEEGLEKAREHREERACGHADVKGFPCSKPQNISFDLGNRQAEHVCPHKQEHCVKRPMEFHVVDPS